MKKDYEDTKKMKKDYWGRCYGNAKFCDDATIFKSAQCVFHEAKILDIWAAESNNKR